MRKKSKILKKSVDKKNLHDIIENVGVDDAGEPPVPIPNTEVKPSGAEDTFLETGWKNREMPTFSSFFHKLQTGF